MRVESLTPLSPEESKKIDHENQQRSRNVKRKMIDVSPWLQSFDFANFTYPIHGKKSLKLIKGEFEDPYDTKTCDNHFGGFEDIYYDYLKGGKTKQALVIITYVSCGCGSCNGGSSLIFAFDVRHHRPHLFWHYETGSRAYGEGLKSMTFQDRKLVIEQFGRCSGKDKKRYPHCRSKYHAKNINRQTFVFNGSTFVNLNKEIIKTPVIDVGAYPLQINVGQFLVRNSED